MDLLLQQQELKDDKDVEWINTEVSGTSQKMIITKNSTFKNRSQGVTP